MSQPHTHKDTIYAAPSDVVEGFRFDDKVVAVFPDMISRSVPGYSTIINMISQLTERYAQHGTHCYDLGCSLGAATLAMRQGLGQGASQKNCTLVGIDNSNSMITHCQKIIDADSSQGSAKVLLIEDDIENTPLHAASIVVLNFTLQFLALEKRTALLTRIADALVPGGVLILSEKLAFDEPRHHELMIDLHHNFKRSQGYSDLEIAQKRQSLENVLIPETFPAHQARLKEAGFSGVELWFQCFNFASMIAFK
ncbi:carboxy-S-adenosyl-L-methionine synthase CmoA [Marinagarivorans algicola]|uniref:carboxy-S-adenosyl-L-methionine synthase CmoA n=1 Tax=Marinagarivorans algicola TaxID=1513270 RepID=UPI0006B49634|nr:carboxy-S-adenosyl-L-methionine synthase CmoA [Marinagarivorans algicola]